MTLWIYKVKVPEWADCVNILEMLRYSRDVVVDIIREPQLILVLGHSTEGNHEQRLKFFRDHILGRWKNFGFEVELSEDLELALKSLEDDKNEA